MSILEVTPLLDKLRTHSLVTYRHSCNVEKLTRSLAAGLGLQEQEIEVISTAGLLHDIGKTRIRPSILHKAASLTREEWEIMRLHPEYGIEILSCNDRFEAILPCVAYHHERWDGGGYHGLSAEEIPLGARIIALADAFEAMTSSRAYQYSKNLRRAIQELEEGAGKQFDPRLVQLFYEIAPSVIKSNCYQAS
ncbi:MAG: hypothetical protein PWP65_802 [Clostridia bacterium]|nr:hypothetical protein [Clostridia bacterium]